MSRVALVFPYVRTRTAAELLFPPLGLAALAAQLRRLGVETRVFDGTFSSVERLAEDVAAYGPDIVGISAMVSLTGNALRLADSVRARLPGCLLVAGGPLPTVFPRRYSDRFDAVFRGEADVSFPTFCRDYLEGDVSRHSMRGLPLERYPGLFIAAGETVGSGAVDNPTVHHGEAELASFPLPDRSDFDHGAYQLAWREKAGVTVTSLMVTLGCPYGCDFCSKPIFGNEVRRRDLDGVFAEIAEIRGLGYESLWIADDTFTLVRDHLEEFCRRIAGTGMSWSCLSRANGVDDEAARSMAAAGCRRVYLGLESGSQATLELMKKQVTVAQGVHAAEVYRAAGIEVAAFFIVGYPGETTASMEQTFALALSLPLDEISFNVPVPLPGSPLFERLDRPDEGRDWTHESEVTFLFPSEIDEAWLRRRIEETMATFARRRDEGRRGAHAGDRR